MRLLSALFLFCSLGHAEVFYPGFGLIGHSPTRLKLFNRCTSRILIYGYLSGSATKKQEDPISLRRSDEEAQ